MGVGQATGHGRSPAAAGLARAGTVADPDTGRVFTSVGRSATVCGSARGGAAGRSHAFASDDEDALMLWRALSGTPGLRTRDLLRQSVDRGLATEDEARAAYRLLQTDDLHNLGGPAW